MLVVTNCAKNDASTIEKSLVENGGRGGKGAVTTHMHRADHTPLTHDTRNAGFPSS